MKTIEYNNHTIKIMAEEEPDHPRDWDNLGTIAHWHPRYCLGEEKLPRGWDFGVWLAKKRKEAIILPVYLYDHSGITISTEPFHCPWDSGQVGFIYVDLEKVRKEYNVKRVSKKMRERIEGYLRGEIKTFDQYLTGDVYGFEVVDQDGNEVDTCWGFYGQEEAIENAKHAVS